MLILTLLQDGKIKQDSFLAGENFPNDPALCTERYAMQPMSDVFIPSAPCFPLWPFYLVIFPIADAYHRRLRRGYGGILATPSERSDKGPSFIEHGIYTRSEERSSSRWICTWSHAKTMDWFSLFQMLSIQKASCITSLFSKAEIPDRNGVCDPEKVSEIISNGIDYEAFQQFLVRGWLYQHWCSGPNVAPIRILKPWFMPLWVS